MTQFATAHLQLHEKALDISSRHRSLEAELIEILIAIESRKIHLALGHASLFVYAVDALGLSEAVAYSFITVARKCRECGPLRTAVAQRRISVSKAARVVSVLCAENAETMLDFAQEHSSREIDREVARIRPRSRSKDRVRPLSVEWESLNCAITPDVAALLRRAQSIASTKLGRAADFCETLRQALGAYLEKNDPVKKAERARKRGKTGTQLCSNRVEPQTKRRIPLSAAETHAVHARDGGRCTHVDPATGKRCESERWLHIHHKISLAQGGGNGPENLTTLCAAHHDLVHQPSFPITG